MEIIIRGRNINYVFRIGRDQWRDKKKEKTKEMR